MYSNINSRTVRAHLAIAISSAICLVCQSLFAGDVFTQKPSVAESQVASKSGAEAKPEKEPEGKSLDLQQGPKAKWIWVGNEDKLHFRKTFNADSVKANLIASCDNVMTIYVNGKRVASSSEWQAPVKVDAQKFLVKGENTITVDAADEGGQAGFACKLVTENAKGEKQVLISDESWQATKSKDSKEPLKIKIQGEMGVQPWGDVFTNPQGGGLVSSTPRGVFNVLPGFQVELMYSVPKATQGSWVSICVDDKGRIIASDQGDKGLYRITPPAIGSNDETKVEKLDLKITSAHGMLYAFDSLYLSINGGPGSGLYRARDTSGDDQFDELVKLKDIAGGGEHGPHALRLSPDGQSIYMVAGNHTQPPKDFNASRIPTNWGEDLLLPRQWDANGHARGILAPGGWIAKTDPDGKNWEIFSIGYRNTYDMDFNADGELFAYDADMEWDLGSPWYRPTRVMHATSGSEFGWRSGTGKWPAYYVDSLPELVDIGPGSPVGVCFGYGAKFPAKYQRALYLCDWTFGTMYAIHMQPDGASYKAEKEEFLSRTPLPLTDVVIDRDGAMYFTVGGRGTDSELYRVTYIGDEATAPVELKNGDGAELRQLRHQLEVFQTRKDPAAVDTLWPYLSHADRHIRYAARVALEKQDVAGWQDRALKEVNPEASIEALVALARQGDRALLPQALDAFARIDFTKLSERQKLDYLRANQLLFIRMGAPDQKTAAEIAARLDKVYPSDSNAENRELCNLLVYLNSPTVIDKTLAMMKNPVKQSSEDMKELLARNAGYGGTIAAMLANLPELQNIHYAFDLRNMRFGWTLEQRRQYFAWLNEAQGRSGGASYKGFINNIRTEAMANLSDAEKLALKSETIAPPPKAEELPTPIGPGKDWKTDEILSLLNSELQKRSFENGKRAFAASRCIVCHRFDGNGGATGPDLTNLAGRFSQKDLVEAITEPNKVISDQYRGHDVETKQGKTYTGRILSEDDNKIVLLADPEDATKIVEIKKSDIEEMNPSKQSLMPAELLKPLNKQEVLDLFAYLLSRGNPNDLMFQKE